MPRLPALGPDDVDPVLAKVFRAFVDQRGYVPPMFATTARRPGYTRALQRLLGEASADGEVPVRLKELIALRVSHHNDCGY